MLSKEEIESWMAIASDSENYKEESYFPHNLKRKFLEVKVLIDRWDLVTTDIILHPVHQAVVREKFKTESAFYTNRIFCLETKSFLETDNLWGIKFTYSEHMPVDKGLALYLAHELEPNYLTPYTMDDKSDRRCAIFPM